MHERKLTLYIQYISIKRPWAFLVPGKDAKCREQEGWRPDNRVN
jgi:hypothetical protein